MHFYLQKMDNATILLPKGRKKKRQRNYSVVPLTVFFFFSKKQVFFFSVIRNIVFFPQIMLFFFFFCFPTLTVISFLLIISYRGCVERIKYFELMLRATHVMTVVNSFTNANAK